MKENENPQPSFPPVFVAIDTPDEARAKELCAAVVAGGGGIKLGLEFFSALGPGGVRRVMENNASAPLFLDLKFHDIPNTVAAAVRAVVSQRPAYINVHAAGGMDMMRAAQDAARSESARLGVPPVRLLAVTVLTSLDESGLAQTGQSGSVAGQVERLALLARDAGLDGVVCSPHEAARLRKLCGPGFVLMVPGIRPAGYEKGSDDQRRIMTPGEAVAAGATHLVIGRPVTAALDPAAALSEILDSLSGYKVARVTA
ncbi:MAG: orotidine-5'-phosphate decarboxylase [Proteobacteria bacterium]|nr:orotidine-5'-phosphate decarboxylase [Pseudomonadota bacterium]